MYSIQLPSVPLSALLSSQHAECIILCCSTHPLIRLSVDCPLPLLLCFSVRTFKPPCPFSTGMTITPDSSRKSEFIAVILAATSGARLFPLTNNASSPKHLLPVGGKPVVLRLLQSLYDTGFTECILALSHEDNDVTVNQLLSQDSHKNLEQVSPGCVFRFRKSLEITIHVLSESCAGSAEALREIRASSTTSIGSSHWVVLPGDLIFSDSNHLSELVDRHRHFYNSTSSNEKTACTMLLADTSEQDEHGVPLKESAKVRRTK
jgi:GTP:adenosylcobinamide-phosphate guanylyltransferase